MAGKVSFDVVDAVGVITFENEGRLNAIDDKVASGLAEAAAQAKSRSDIGALVLRGGGDKAFCSGVDLKYATESGDRPAAFRVVDKHVTEFCRDMTTMPFPTIAMVRTICYGGGVQLAVTTDFRFADSSLRLAIPAVKNGLFYPIQALERLNRLIGQTRTRRLILEGAIVSPEMLLAWGFCDEICAPAEIEAQTMAFAARLAAQPHDVVRRYMDIFRALDEGATDEARRLRAEGRGAPGG